MTFCPFLNIHKGFHNLSFSWQRKFKKNMLNFNTFYNKEIEF